MLNHLPLCKLIRKKISRLEFRIFCVPSSTLENLATAGCDNHENSVTYVFVSALAFTRTRLEFRIFSHSEGHNGYSVNVKKYKCCMKKVPWRVFRGTNYIYVFNNGGLKTAPQVEEPLRVPLKYIVSIPFPRSLGSILTGLKLKRSSIFMWA